ncbi:MAG: hypothetical protein IJC84_00040 [Clostridia bacterium]|nr:hypothetical protein [Clostridia bacterium]
MKRILLWILAGLLLLPTLFACGSEQAPLTIPATTESATEETDEKTVIRSDILDVPEVVWDQYQIYRYEKKIPISPLLQKKMDTCDDPDAVYRVFVELHTATKGYLNFTLNNDYADTLSHISSVAYEKKQAAEKVLSGIYDPEKRRVLQEEIGIISAVSKAASYHHIEYLEQKELEHLDDLISKLLAEAAALSDTPPVRHNPQDPIKLFYAYQGHGYYMELTKEEILYLAEKGGYCFRMADGDLTYAEGFLSEGDPADEAP